MTDIDISGIPVPDGLSDAQATVYRYSMLGYTAKEIAKLLGRSFKTIENHVWHMHKALGKTGRKLIVWHYREFVPAVLKSIEEASKRQETLRLAGAEAAP